MSSKTWYCWKSSTYVSPSFSNFRHRPDKNYKQFLYHLALDNTNIIPVQSNFFRSKDQLLVKIYVIMAILSKLSMLAYCHMKIHIALRQFDWTILKWVLALSWIFLQCEFLKPAPMSRLHSVTFGTGLTKTTSSFFII
jgi:hypothetical protein